MKLHAEGNPGPLKDDAPHTGARLETYPTAVGGSETTMPPTRGHDLKLLRVELEAVDE